MAKAEPQVRLGLRLKSTTSAFAALLAATFVGTGSYATRAGATPEPAVPAVQFGPIRFGMSVAEIQAAVPGARWEVTSKSQYTGRTFRMVAPDALDYGGWRMKIDVREEKYDRHVELTSRITAPDAAACEQAGLELLTALEGSAGLLVAGRDPNGESVAFGSDSTALFNAYDANSNRLPRKRLGRGKVDRMGLSTKREAERVEVKGSVSFDARSPDNCSAQVIAIGWREQPPPEVMPYDERKLIGAMSIGDRHRLASTLDFTSDAVVVARQCQVSRQSGKVLMCAAVDDPALDPAFADVAGRYAGAMTFDMTGLDRDDPQPVLVEIPVRVARSDVRPLDLPATLLPMADVVFATTPAARDIRDSYPWRALRSDIGAQVDIACRIQDDGSLICRTLAVRQHDGRDEHAAAFGHAVEKLVPGYRAAPTLKNGQPSTGAAFGMGVQFATES
jgi:hypothetical protein